MHRARVACQYVKGDASDVYKGAGSSLLAREFSHAWLIGAVHMKTIQTNRWPGVIMALSFAVITVACGRSAPLQDGSAVAAEPTAAWVTAFNGGDATVLAALYALGSLR